MLQGIVNSCQSHNYYNCLVLWWFHLQIKIPVENWFGNIIQSFIKSYSQETLFKVITDLDGFWNFFFRSHEKHDNEHANMTTLMLSLKRFEPCFVSDVTSFSAMLVFSLTIHVLWQSHTSFFCTETGMYFVLVESLKDFRHLYFLCPLCVSYGIQKLQTCRFCNCMTFSYFPLLQFMSSYFRRFWWSIIIPEIMTTSEFHQTISFIWTLFWIWYEHLVTMLILKSPIRPWWSQWDSHSS